MIAQHCSLAGCRRIIAVAGGSRLVASKVARRILTCVGMPYLAKNVQQNGSAAYLAAVTATLLTPDASAANKTEYSRNYRRCVEGRVEADVSGFGTTPS